jgi:DNA ligase 1
MDWSRTVPSLTNPKKTYTIKSVKGVISCNCQAWKNQSLPITCRTCKHLIAALSKESELKRAPNSYNKIFRRGPKRNKVINAMLYHTLDEKLDIINWYASIKLNGMFGRWDGSKLTTKTGRQLHPPQYIINRLPTDVQLDGEIYHPDLQEVRKAVLGDVWERGVEFVVFDLYDLTLSFEKRWEKLQELHKTYDWDRNVKLAKQYRITDLTVLKHLMEKVVMQNEEGLVLHDPKGLYEPGKRVWTTLKWKPTKTGTGKVLEITHKQKGYVVRVQEMDTDNIFNVFTYDNLKNLKEDGKEDEKKDQIVSFTYSGRTDTGKPELVKLLNL